jgi:hypothetical protein
MRKIYKALGIVAMAVSSMFVNAQVNLTQNFNTGGTPTGWTVTGFGQSTTLPCEGAGSMRRNFYSSAPTGTLTSPTQVAAGFDIDVAFSYKIIDWSAPNPATTGNWGTMLVQYSVDGGTNWTTFHTINQTNHVVSTSCALVELTIPGASVPVASNFRVRFSGTWASGDYYFYVDQFSMLESVPCPGVTGLSASNIGLTTADITWTSGAGDFNIEWSTSLFTPGTGQQTGSASSSTNSYSMNGLNQATTYYVSVQADCGIDGVSSWSTPIQFTTSSPGDNCGTALDLATLTSPYVGTTTGFNDSFSQACAPNTAPDMIFFIEVPANAELVIGQTSNSYDSRNYVGFGGSCPGATEIACFDDPDVQDVTWFNNTGSSQIVYWIQDGFGTANGAFELAWTLTAITCPDPSGLTLDNLTSTTADVSWTAGGTESNWNIEWGAPGFAPGTGAEIGADVATANSYSITGLNPETNYQVYVQADCGAVDGTSEWVGPLNVFTGYCTAGPTSTADSEILGVTLNGAASSINNTTPCPAETGVQNFTAQSVILVRGETYDLDVLMGTCADPYPNTIKAWVDYNQNLQLEEPSEQLGVLTQTTSVAGVTGTLTFTVPLTANLGETRLRVMMRETTTASSVTPCATYSWGSAHDYTVEIIDGPSAPPTPVQDASAPTCDLGTDLTVTGTPDEGIVWYWQETAAGTATNNPYSGARTVFANGTYYIRAYDETYDLWSDASFVTVSNFPLVADAPPVPVAGANPVCLPGTEISMPAPEDGFVYYWQTIENGTSTANNAATPWEINATGTYYVATFEPATNCWSETSSITVTVDTYVPAAPSVTESVYNICVGEISQEIEAVAPADGTAVVNFGSNLTWPVGGTTINGNINLPSGATVTSAELTINGVTTTSSTWATDLQFNLTGAANVPPTTLSGQVVTNAGPFTYPVTVTGSGAVSLFLINNWSLGGTGTSQSIVLTVNYSLPASTINWHDAAVAGDLVGSGSPFEAIGSSIMNSPAEAGVYEFYASSESGACSSAERTLVTVNVTPVAVDIIGVDATCNGGNNGTFSVLAVDCGNAPFTFSVNGGAFGSIPSDLTAGTYSVVVRDANNEESAVYTVVVGEPSVVTEVDAIAISASEVEVSWTAVGTETEWIIEYGEAGFTVGTGATVQVTSNPATVSGLNSYTDYEFYVRALCAEGFEGDNSAAASAKTLPSCDDTVFDNGGEDGNYLSNSDELYVICPQNAGDYVQIEFTSFETEESFDGIYVFDGSDVTAPLIASENPAGFGGLTEPGAYWGEEIPGPFFASNEDGCLTIQFLSDGSVSLAGFEFTVTCFPQVLTPGVDGEEDICRLDGTVDLFDIITAGDDFGTWSFPANPSLLNGSILTVSGLPAGTYTAEYIVINPFDTTVTVATVTIYPPSNAGQSGVIESCNFGPVNLFDGLTGTVDLGGTWYDPADDELDGALVVFNGQLAASYNYYYVTSNGVCPADTSFVEVQLQNCASVNENELQGFEVYPNPTSDVIHVNYSGVAMEANFMLTDAKGAVIFAEKKNISVEAAYEMDLSKLERGVYFLNIFGTEGSKVIKVVRN